MGKMGEGGGDVKSFHDFEMKSISGESVSLSDYAGQLCLVVNVASRCGLTPQYAGLQTLHEKNESRGFKVLGFPCNQFGSQEPGTDEQIQEFACSRFDVSFPMFSKIEVNGKGACDLYKWLKAGHPDEEGKEDIAWNFTKFLVGRDGRVLARFGPGTPPEEIHDAIQEHL
jgi:glutathione peroxidase